MRKMAMLWGFALLLFNQSPALAQMQKLKTGPEHRFLVKENGEPFVWIGETNWFFEEEGAVRSTTRIVSQGEHVVGFNLLGRRWDHSVLIRWIEERRTLPWVLEHLTEASFDTEFVPPLRVPRS